MKREATIAPSTSVNGRLSSGIVAGWVDGLGQRRRFRLGGGAGGGEIGFEARDGGDVVGVGEGPAAGGIAGQLQRQEAERAGGQHDEARAVLDAGLFQRRIELAREQRPEFRADAVDGREPCLGRGLLALVIHKPARGLPCRIGAGAASA